MIDTSFKSLISIKDFSPDDILRVLHTAEAFKENPPGKLCSGKTAALLFFEPSTRTRLTFELAAKKLGCEVIGFSDTESSSLKKGESLSDTIRITGDLADILILRHFHEGSSKLAERFTNTPIINAGDGGNEHPSQTLIDLFSIKETQKRIDNLAIGLSGDLKYSRTIHSLIKALAAFSPRFYFFAEEEGEPPQDVLDSLRESRIKFSFHSEFVNVLPKLDILYMTRLQHERRIKKIQTQLILTPDKLHGAKANLKILHPLPRLNEIDPRIDNLQQAYYFEQAKNGLFVRQALMALILGGIS